MSSSPVTTPIASTPGCWDQFTTGASALLQRMASAVASLFAAIKNAFAQLAASIAPRINDMITWVKANPQPAMIGGGVAAVAAAAGLYYCFCTGDKTPKADDKTKNADDKSSGKVGK